MYLSCRWVDGETETPDSRLPACLHLRKKVAFATVVVILDMSRKETTSCGVYACDSKGTLHLTEKKIRDGKMSASFVIRTTIPPDCRWSYRSAVVLPLVLPLAEGGWTSSLYDLLQPSEG